MTGIKKQIEKLREEIKIKAGNERREAYKSGLCASCGVPMPEERKKHGSYTCSHACMVKCIADHDYSLSSPILREKRKDLKKEKKPMKRSGTSTARVKDTCKVCNGDIVPGEQYEWIIPEQWEDAYDPDHPFAKFKYHTPCVKNFYAIADGIFKLYMEDDFGEEVDIIVNFAKNYGGIKSFDWAAKIDPEVMSKYRAELDEV